MNNQFNRKTQRTLRITNKGIANIRTNGDISSFYTWSMSVLKTFIESIWSLFISIRWADVKEVALISLEVLRLVYKTGSHPYPYSSPNALQIVQYPFFALPFASLSLDTSPSLCDLFLSFSILNLVVIGRFTRDFHFGRQQWTTLTLPLQYPLSPFVN